MIIDGEEHAITPEVWAVFDGWYGEKSYRHAGFVADIEAAVRAQVARERAAEEGDRLLVNGRALTVTEYVDIDGDEDAVCYEVWVKRGDDSDERQ